ncbi:hypothetical protein MZO42_08710 [Sphingomonas psychrotolerans]|uniref:Secreted protein n=1 Tax=Sphingomonas psychrotolerans TaxID=1327635 RepID=A0ABU3N2T2_9SPHN|nr:hypothetical protein [Sphingomonas psychrotolerans]MDT8758778.1 hypothetical protein [Sphingomonas psychrotolerans]
MTSILKSPVHAITLIAGGALAAHSAAAGQNAPVSIPNSGLTEASRPGDEARSCAEIEDEVNGLLEKLGRQSEALASASGQVVETGVKGSRTVKNAARKSVATQGFASAASDVASVLPGGALVSGLIGSAAGAAIAADNRKLAERQQVLSREMQANMAALQQQASAAMPDAMRLQHLTELQAVKKCPGSDR